MFLLFLKIFALIQVASASELNEATGLPNKISKKTRMLYNNRIEVIHLYNEMTRWTRESEEFGIKGRLSPEAAVVYILGEDFHLLEQFLPEMNEKYVKAMTIIQDSNQQGSGTNRGTYITAEFYSVIYITFQQSLKDPASRTGTCGSRLSPSHLQPNQTHLFSYVNATHSLTKPVGQFLQQYFKNIENEAHMDIDIGHLSEKEQIGEVLHQIHDLGTDYLETVWTDDPEKFCTFDLPDFQALLALEERMIENLSENDGCYTKIEESIKMSLDSALQYLDKALADEELLNVSFSQNPVHIDAKALVETHKLFKKQTRSNLGLLAWQLVQQLLTSKITINSCDNCSCSLQGKISKFQKSIERIASVLPLNGKMCEKSWDSAWLYIDRSLTEYMLQVKGILFNDIYTIEHIDYIYEVFSTRMPKYYQSPYAGVPYANMPIKHGLWWLASHFFSLDNCDQFTVIHQLRNLLETYANNYYYSLDNTFFPECGFFSVQDPVESVVMAELLGVMVNYDGLRKFDFYEAVTSLKLYGGNLEPTINTFQRYSAYLFRDIINEELPLDKEYYGTYVENFIKQNVIGNGQGSVDDVITGQKSILFKRCGTCEIIDFHKRINELTYMKFLNYAEGRIFPKQFEQKQYSAGKEVVLERDMHLFSELKCGLTSQEDFDRYKLSGERFWSSEYLEDPNVFSLYLETQNYGIDVGELTNTHTLQDLQEHFRNLTKMEQFVANASSRMDYFAHFNLTDTSLYADQRGMFDTHPSTSAIAEELKVLYRNYTQSTECLIMRMGVFEFDPRKMVSPINCISRAGDEVSQIEIVINEVEPTIPAKNPEAEVIVISEVEPTIPEKNPEPEAEVIVISEVEPTIPEKNPEPEAEVIVKSEVEPTIPEKNPEPEVEVIVTSEVEVEPQVPKKNPRANVKPKNQKTKKNQKAGANPAGSKKNVNPRANQNASKKNPRARVNPAVPRNTTRTNVNPNISKKNPRPKAVPRVPAKPGTGSKKSKGKKKGKAPTSKVPKGNKFPKSKNPKGKGLKSKNNGIKKDSLTTTQK